MLFIVSAINQLLMEGQKYAQPFREVFLFINSSSGGGLGKEILQKKIKQLKFEVPRTQYEKDKNNLVRVDIHFFNMKEGEDKKIGFNKLKKALEEKKEPILVICGGDGTVMWVVTELAEFEIDHLKVPMAIIPLGTGNDFSQTIGWGKQSPDLLDNDYSKLKKRVTYWLSAQQQNLDIWMVEAEVQQYGKFQKVEGGKNKTLDGKIFTKHFCNYFSVGVDGKIGYSFDMHRTTTRMGNLAMYGVLGLVKSFTKTKSLGQLAVSFKDQSITPVTSDIERKKLIGEQLRQTNIIFQQGADSLNTIKDNQNLVALNINSFMGGIKDIWKNAKAQSNQKFNLEQSHSDGKLQFVSFSGSVALGLQKASSGNAHKVYQGQGPFQLLFKKYPAEQKHRTYLQIDGQFIRFTHPSKLVIKKSSLSSKSQIRVLRRIPLQIQKGCCA